MSQTISSNISYRFIFAQTDPVSILTASRVILIPNSIQLIDSLGVGEVIFKESQGYTSSPMLVKLDYHEVTNKIIKYDTHPHVPGKSLSEIPGVSEAIKLRKNKKRQEHLEKAREKNSDITDNARKLIDLCSLYPLTPTSKLWHYIDGKLSPTAKKSIMDKLEQKELVTFTLARTGRMNLFLSKITDKGWQYLDKSKPNGLGSGNIMHQFGINVIKQDGEKRGYQSFSEWEVPPLKKHRADDAWITPDGKIICFEVVTTCDRNIIEHLKACFIDSDQVDEVRIVTYQKKEHAKLQEKIGSEEALKTFSNRIKYESLEPYVKELWP